MKVYPSKVLLLGEYTILNGSKALALPYSSYQGSWSYDETPSEHRTLSRESLKSFCGHHSAKEFIDLTALIQDVERGLWFDSTIPNGYGLGSSGALIAAIYDSYTLKKDSLLESKTCLGRLEDYFHGSSSGLDPLVSLVQKPLMIHSFEDVNVYEKPISLEGFFLMNTGKPRQTGPLVSIYKEKMKDPEFKKGCAEILAREVNFALDSLLKNDRENLFHHLWHISKFQWEYFPEMIPTNVRGAWSHGLETNEYVLKLCGAGGGGFVLGFSKGEKPQFQEFQIEDLEV